MKAALIIFLVANVAIAERQDPAHELFAAGPSAFVQEDASDLSSTSHAALVSQLADANSQLASARLRIAQLEETVATLGSESRTRTSGAPPWLRNALKVEAGEDIPAATKLAEGFLAAMADACKPHMIGADRDGKKALEECESKHTELMNEHKMDAAKFSEKLTKKCKSIIQDLRIPTWLKDNCNTADNVYDKLEATGKDSEDPEFDCEKLAKGVGMPCPGLKAHFDDLKAECLSFTPVQAATAATATGDASDNPALMSALARIQEIELTCPALLDAVEEKLEDVTKELDEVTLKVNELAATKEKMREEYSQRREKETEGLEGVPKMLKLNALRSEENKVASTNTKEFALQSSIMRNLGVRKVIAGPDVPLLKLDEFYNMVEDRLVHSEKWTDKIGKFNPCMPGILAGGQEKQFQNELAGLLSYALQRPEHLGPMHWAEMVVNALNGDIYLLKTMRKLGYPGLNELKTKIYDRLLSVSEGKLFGPGSGYVNYQFGVRCIGQVD